MLNQNLYETNSLILAAALICMGFPIDSRTKNTDGKTFFCFVYTKELDAVKEAFWKKELRIEPNSLWETIRYLKSLIYEK